jgi:hypothetical protein
MCSDRWSGFGELADEAETTKRGLKRVRREMRDGFCDRIGETEKS